MNLLMSRKDVPELTTLTEFAQWYVRSGMPMMLPEHPETFLSDDATSFCIFRHGRFQFELYLIHPDPVIPKHEHPGVENIEIPHAASDAWLKNDLQPLVQKNGEAHGVGFVERGKHSGFMLLSAQKWDDGIEMSTIGARWKGHTAGPKHEALIKRFNPDCLVYPGYADVTQKTSKTEIL